MPHNKLAKKNAINPQVLPTLLNHKTSGPLGRVGRQEKRLQEVRMDLTTLEEEATRKQQQVSELKVEARPYNSKPEGITVSSL